MHEIIEIAFSKANIVLSILLLLLVIYWIFTLVSGIDFDTDFDIDVDIDADVDVDMSGVGEGSNIDVQDVANAEIDPEHVGKNKRRPLKWWEVFLVYFHFVGLPFMFTFTAWIFFWWISTIFATILTNSYNNVIGVAIMLGGMIPALFITKMFTYPFKSFFKHLNKDGDKAVDFIGRLGTAETRLNKEKLGRVDLTVDGNIITIYAKTLDGEVIPHGTEVLIIKQSTDKSFFWVQAHSDSY